MVSVDDDDDDDDDVIYPRQSIVAPLSLIDPSVPGINKLLHLLIDCV